MQANDRPAFLGVDVAKPGADRTVVRFAPPSPGSELSRRWNQDPVSFARDLGVELDKKERRVLRDAMKNKPLSGKRAARALESARQKIEASLRRANAAHTEAAASDDMTQHAAEIIQLANAHSGDEAE